MSIPTFEYVEGEVHYKFRSCPAGFIPLSIKRFLMVLNYHREFPSARMPALDEVSSRFYLAYLVYNRHLEDYKLLLRQNKD
jgi:hypothetical protein